MRKITKYTLIILASLILIYIFLPSHSVFAGQVSSLTDGFIYNLKNKASDKMLNVNLGKDAQRNKRNSVDE